MLLIFKILFLCALLRLLISTDQPFLCSGLYTGGVFVLGLVFGAPFVPLLIASVIRFALSSLYFWLLDRFSEGMLWWLIMLLGIPLLLV